MHRPVGAHSDAHGYDGPMEERVRAAFDRFNADGPEAIRELLDLDVEMLAPQPGPWDCHGREAVLRFLGSYRAAGQVADVIEVTDHGDRLVLGLRRTHPDGGSSDHFSVLTLRGTRLRQIRGYPSRTAALVAAEGIAIEWLTPNTRAAQGEYVYVGGPLGGDRGRRQGLAQEVEMPGGRYVRSPACADDGAVRYVWSEDEP